MEIQNDVLLFGWKTNEPYQISLHARALSDDLELERRPTVDPRQKKHCSLGIIHAMNGTATDGNIAVCYFFRCCLEMQVSSFPGANHHQATGIGVFITTYLDGNECNVTIQASAPASFFCVSGSNGAAATANSDFRDQLSLQISPSATLELQGYTCRISPNHIYFFGLKSSTSKEI